MLRNWPENERPREKLISHGVEHLTDAELLAIFLGSGTKNLDAVALGRQLLSNFGSLHNLCIAEREAFCQQLGVGNAKYAQLHACLEISRRFLASKLDAGVSLRSSSHTKQYLISQLKHEPHEVFSILLLDSQHKVLAYKKLFFGTIDCASVYPRVVVETTLKYRACALILSHNHPSGIAEPSLADKQITEKLVKALALIDVTVLDHIIVAGHLACSLAERGDM
ncbi:DNA repair protein RadC [Thalassotalea ponticola]|uniref:RadC family protein n=1 Tax=Thalassotalea ponticola TaxID=1523392 RepID=UPI0025B5EF85|nr:DNA repair protein RadC [Thalassotalea ponticola]MDN3652806.1 DNA repair protein RadC [Thalassotalea ponticola]